MVQDREKDMARRVNSRRKGVDGELQWAKHCRTAGFDARRSQQYCGTAGDADVVSDDLDKFHMEVKRVERLNVLNAMEQAKQDCAGRVPVVAHRKDHCEWLVTMRAEDWFDLVREVI